MTSLPGPDPSRLEELREEAAHRRRRVDLYRAKSYGPRATSPARLRELDREAAAAEGRLAAALARASPDRTARARHTGPPTSEPGQR